MTDQIVNNTEEQIRLPNGKVVEFKKIPYGKLVEILESCEKYVLVGGKPIRKNSEAKLAKLLILNGTNITEEEYYSVLDFETGEKVLSKLIEMHNLNPSKELGK